MSTTSTASCHFPSVVARQTSNSSMEVVGRAFVPRCRSRRSRASRGLSDLPTTDLRHFLQSPLHIVVNQQFRCAFGYFELPQLLALDDPVSRSTGQTEIGSGSLRRAKSHPMPNYLQVETIVCVATSNDDDGRHKMGSSAVRN
ncbi:hypothetical protein ZOSMA_59G00060 [Zostera marina]|uniref:Uncharacterized protein n=1 Tax=Zostera marina TaxID=29655 RepID=A0A0K9NUH5_ZOSMR|nr:hypothetical protein ZOSMA_59G00060 [Zostera marina]